MNNSTIMTTCKEGLCLDDKLDWYVLPTYETYSSTLDNDYLPDPPSYELPELASSSVSTVESSLESDLSPFSTLSIDNEHDQPQQEQNYLEQNYLAAHLVSEKLLDNVDKLTNLSNTRNRYSDAIDISVNLIEKKQVDEHSQGGCIHGYVLINNNDIDSIPFESFTIALEGEFKTSAPVKTKKFLQMLDFSATYAQSGCFGVDHLVRPGTTYKQFFTFKIPDRLLDSTCLNSGVGLTTHTNLPPTLGGGSIIDFPTIGSSVKYGIWARFIGKSSKYDVDSIEEFVILKDVSKLLRMTPYSDARPTYDQCKRQFEIFLSNVNDSITQGKRRILQEQEISRPTSENEKCSLESISSKMTGSAPPNENEKSHYSLEFPIFKTKSFKKSTPVSKLVLKSPRTAYNINYTPPKETGTVCSDDPSWVLHIPLELSLDSSPKSLHIKSITSELVGVTIESVDFPIPVELHHDLLFNKIKPTRKTLQEDLDGVRNNLVIPVKLLNNELYEVSLKAKDLGFEYSVEDDLKKEIRAFCDMNISSTRLEMKEPKLNQVPQKKALQRFQWDKDGESMTKSYTVECDLRSLRRRVKNKNWGYSEQFVSEHITLVPSFQSCHLCRIYYINLKIELSNRQNIYFKVPLNVVKED